MNLLKQMKNFAADFEKAIQEAKDEGRSEGYDILENEVAAALGDEANNVVFTIVEHAKRIRMERDRLIKDGDRMYWLNDNRWFCVGENVNMRKAIDAAMNKEEEQ